MLWIISFDTKACVIGLAVPAHILIYIISNNLSNHFRHVKVEDLFMINAFYNELLPKIVNKNFKILNEIYLSFRITQENTCKKTPFFYVKSLPNRYCSSIIKV